MNINSAHAHISTAATDCDGPMYRDYTVFVSDEAKAKSAETNGVNDFWDIEFRRDILNSQVSVYAVEHGLTMTADDAGFSWREVTDEGVRSGEVLWCDMESCNPSYSQRDVYAEMMGF